MEQDTLEAKLMWLLDKSRSLIACRDSAQLIKIALNAFLEITSAERGCFFVMQRDANRLVLGQGQLATGEELLEADARILAVAVQVVKDRRAILATDGPSPELLVRRPVSELRLKQLVCVPLISENETLGALYADGKIEATRYVPSRAIELFADHVASALDNARVFERANNDLLTGLPNNSYFLFQLAKAIREATPQSCGGILLIDLDAFKRINQAAGAEMGDRALIDIAHTLREVLRADGLVARYGSDKFAVLLPPESSTAIGLRLRDVAERARAAVSTKNYHGIALSASIGGVGFPSAKGAQSAQEVVAVADNILGRARARGPAQLEIGDGLS